MREESECLFCEIIDGDRPSKTILEVEQFVCFLDKYPVTNDHALVVPREHIQYFAEIDSPELFSFLQRAHSEICREYSPDATNIGLNNGQKVGQTVPHLHWHIIPRYD